MVINIAHTSAIMYKIFFHTYMIPWYQKFRNKISNIFSFFIMLDTAFYREEKGEIEWKPFCYFYLLWVQICTVCAFISVIELPRIPAYYPKKLVYLWIIERYRICKSSSSSIELFYKKIIGLIPKSHQEIFLISWQLLFIISLNYCTTLMLSSIQFWTIAALTLR